MQETQKPQETQETQEPKTGVQDHVFGSCVSCGLGDSCDYFN
jgi:hypothetical protein